MRTFVYFSASARTTGNFDIHNLMDAGRMDIAIHVIINAFFLSHNLRNDVVLHLVFYGSPDPPKHIEMRVNSNTNLSKKDVANFIRKMLYKYKQGKKNEVFKGCFIEKKNLFDVVAELQNNGKEVFLLDEDGEDIRKVESKDFENSVFLLGDHKGLPKKELKRLKQRCKAVKVGNKVYFASQVVTIVNNELDTRGI